MDAVMLLLRGDSCEAVGPATVRGGEFGATALLLPRLLGDEGGEPPSFDFFFSPKDNRLPIFFGKAARGSGGWVGASA
jgi:hypothetical protein